MKFANSGAAAVLYFLCSDPGMENNFVLMFSKVLAKCEYLVDEHWEFETKFDKLYLKFSDGHGFRVGSCHFKVKVSL